MNDALFYTLLLAGAELIEAFIQRAPTLYGVLQKLYLYYRKHIFLFFLVQPGFYTLLFIIMKTGVLNAPMIFLVALKVFDIFYKMELIRQLFVRQEISVEFAQMLEWSIPSWFFMLGVGLYPPMLYYALS
ncbi:MAG: hypothetical protein DSZ10_01205 [Sulfurovum sp.]|nr:MAG: hypothetical protein DSZ10_01205 [Sulfurovum sp.]